MKLIFTFKNDGLDYSPKKLVEFLNQYDRIRKKQVFLQFGPVSSDYLLPSQRIRKFPYQIRFKSDANLDARFIYESEIFKKERLDSNASFMHQTLLVFSGKNWKLSYAKYLASSPCELEFYDFEFAAFIKTVQEIVSLTKV